MLEITELLDRPEAEPLTNKEFHFVENFMDKALDELATGVAGMIDKLSKRTDLTDEHISWIKQWQSIDLPLERDEIEVGIDIVDEITKNDPE